eukprot:2956189-Lingulodinium_polyedra.AAC.1
MTLLAYEARLHPLTQEAFGWRPHGPKPARTTRLYRKPEPTRTLRGGSFNLQPTGRPRCSPRRAHS